MEENSEVMERQMLFIAAMKGDISVLEEARHKEIESCDEEYFLRQTFSDKYNILHIAVKYRKNEFIGKVLKGLLPRAVTDKMIHQRDKGGNTPLHAAAEEDNLEFCRLLHEYEKGQQDANETKPVDYWSVKNEDGNTTMHVAFIKRKVGVAEWLVNQHRELAGVTNNDRNTPLHVAAALGDDIIMNLIIDDEYEEWKPMLRMQNDEGNTPLHVALINANSAVAKYLVYWFMRLSELSDVVRICNKLKETPLHLAIKHFCNLVEGKRGDLKKPNNSEEPIDGEKMDEKLLHIAKDCESSFIEEERNKQIENEYFLRQDNHGDNILHIAIRSESSKRHEFIEQITKGLFPRSIVDKLMNQRNNDGNTPLHVATDVGNISIFNLFFLYKDWHYYGIKNANGNTPLHVALIKGNIDLAIHIFKESRDHFDEDLMPVYIEAMNNLIEKLVQKERQVACWHDVEGLTPLHRSAFLYPNCCLQVIEIILKLCPESAKEIDSDGKTILHLMINRIPSYKQGIELLVLQISKAEEHVDVQDEEHVDVQDEEGNEVQKDPKIIEGLMDVKDNQGNKPLDLAWKFNFKMVRPLLDTLSLQDQHGRSTTTHIQQISKINKMIKKQKRTLEEYGVIEGANIKFLRDKIRKYGMNFLVSRDSKGRNVLHNLMHLKRRAPIVYDEYVGFVKHVLHSHPTLICQTDFNGDTPIHILMQNSHETMTHCRTTKSATCSHINLTESSLYQELLDLCFTYFYIAKEVAKAGAGKTEEEGWHFKYDEPWLAHNMSGNTPLHEALKENHIMPLLSILLQKDNIIDFGSINTRKETLLHLLAGNISVKCELVEAIMNLNEEAAFRQDQDGLTPIMRAAQVGHIKTVMILDKLNNEASKIADENGQTLWHMLINQSPSKVKELVDGITERPHLKYLLKIQDKEGKTPLHKALESRQFIHALHFLGWAHGDELEWLEGLLEIKDANGITSGDLLASVQELPRELEKRLSNYPIQLMGYRSVYGIPTTEMKDYVNTMGVIAALLATISFTAAFTVPGGAFQDDKDVKDKRNVGTPLLIKEVAFQAFMFFDISTMCLSTMVLFCLLWISGAGSKRKSVILMDFSIYLLSISFYTTLLSFMTGVYATTIHVKPWIAIYTLVICSLLMSLIMSKRLIISLLGPIPPVGSYISRRFFTKFLVKLLKRGTSHSSE